VHLLILIILGLMFIILLQTQSQKYSASNQTASSAPGDNDQTHTDKQSFDGQLAFIAKGKLFHCTQSGQIEEIHSQHLQTVIERDEKSRQLNAWKNNTSFKNRYFNDENLSAEERIGMRISSGLFIEEDKLYYFLESANMGGLFEYNLSTGQEKRLLHKQNLVLSDFHFDVKAQRILCCVRSSNGICNIASLNREGEDITLYTEGDTIDSSPTSYPDQPGKIVIQSAGIARGEQGHMVGIGPSSLQLLETDTTSLSLIVEHPNVDYMNPRVHPDGKLYYIRRPYEGSVQSPTQTLIDALAFPFRLARAVFHYLNFFSLMYSRKPLSSASGPDVQADLKDIVLKGKRIDAEKALRKEDAVRGVPSLVPRSWELVCRNNHGQETVVATNVASFDITQRGDIIYTNGCGVFKLSSGSTELLAQDRLIETLLLR